MKHVGKEGSPILPDNSHIFFFNNSHLNAIHAFHVTTWFEVFKK